MRSCLSHSITDPVIPSFWSDLVLLLPTTNTSCCSSLIAPLSFQLSLRTEIRFFQCSVRCISPHCAIFLGVYDIGAGLMSYMVGDMWWILGGVFFPFDSKYSESSKIGWWDLRGVLPASPPSHPGGWQVLLPISFKFKVKTAIPISSRVASQGCSPTTPPFVPLLWSVSQ